MALCLSQTVPGAALRQSKNCTGCGLELIPTIATQSHCPLHHIYPKQEITSNLKSTWEYEAIRSHKTNPNSHTLEQRITNLISTLHQIYTLGLLSYLLFGIYLNWEPTQYATIQIVPGAAWRQSHLCTGCGLVPIPNFYRGRA